MTFGFSMAESMLYTMVLVWWKCLRYLQCRHFFRWISTVCQKPTVLFEWPGPKSPTSLTLKAFDKNYRWHLANSECICASDLNLSANFAASVDDSSFFKSRHCRRSMLTFVNYHHDERKIWPISSISEILSQNCYRCAQYTKTHCTTLMITMLT